MIERINKKGSVVLVFLVMSILIVSSGLIITREVGKSNSENDVSGTGLVLIDGGEQDALSNLDFLSEREEDNVDDFVSEVSSNSESSSSRSSRKSSSSSSRASSSPESSDSSSLTENSSPESSDSGDVVEEDEDFEISSVVSTISLDEEATNSFEVKSVESNNMVIMFNGDCKAGSMETNEGPGGDYCVHEDYEECYNYFVKSTVIAYDCNLLPLGCYEVDRGTDYCIDYSRLNEAWLNCGLTNLASDTLRWKEKDCNDYDDESDWVYYCTSSEVRKKKRFSNFGCSNGACNFLYGWWFDDTFVSRNGYSDYCSKRKQYGCSLCGHEDFDCDRDSECSGNLDCMGPGILACSLKECGCCFSGETWDKTRNECCECDDASDPCCDGCNYESSSKVCDYHYGSYKYGCSNGNCLGDNVKKRDKKRYCSGSSSSCSGNTVWNSPITHDSCSTSEFCDKTPGSWYSSAFSCSKAQCTSGVCCDTDCGDYFYESSYVQCSEEIEYGCPWGTDLGDGVGKRTVTQDCSGSSSYCNGEINEGSWIINNYCTNNQYCFDGECESIACSDYFDCGGAGTNYWFCKDDDVWARWNVNVCHNPGTKESYCTSHQEDRFNEDCLEDEYGGNYCFENDVYTNFIDRGCTGHAGGGSGHADCFENETKELVKDCQQGCSNGKCSEESCTNECSSGEIRCNGDYKQTCGNYDIDSCLEWNSGEYCEYGCLNGECNTQTCTNECSLGQTTCDGDYKQTCGNYDDDSCLEWGGDEYCEYGCENGECKEQDFDLPDLTVTDLRVQNVNGKEVVLGFTIRNIGSAIAENVYWMVDTDSDDENPERTSSANLTIGGWIRAYMKIIYLHPGIYNPKVIVDHDNLVDESDDESDETNNEKTIFVVV